MIKKLKILLPLVAYNLLLHLILPLLFFRLFLKQKRHRAHQLFSQNRRWRERLGSSGHYLLHDQAVDICFHCVSVGEFLALKPLIEQIVKQHPQMHIMLTCTTLTGSDQILKSFQGLVSHVYLPWDTAWAVRRFYRRYRIKKLIIMETEIWPNLLIQAKKLAIPCLLVNARLSLGSLKSYQRLSLLSQYLLQHFQAIAAQSQTDRERFLQLGAQSRQVLNTGNIKYDLQLDEKQLQQGKHLREQLNWQQCLVILAASTHQGEEKIILDVFTKLAQTYVNLALIVVPRHPERFSEVGRLIQEYHRPMLVRSQLQTACDDSRCLLGDSLGEMMMYYAMSDIVIMGGSLVAHGGHNILEPAALSRAIIFGPWMFNFDAVRQTFLQQQAAIQLEAENSSEVTQSLLQQLEKQILCSQQRVALGKRAYALIQQNRGARQKLYSLIFSDTKI